MIQFLILLAISPILVPIFAFVCAVIGALAGLWFCLLLMVGACELFLSGWSND